MACGALCFRIVLVGILVSMVNSTTNMTTTSMMLLDDCNSTNLNCSNRLTPTEDFYYNYVLEQSGDPSIMGGVSWKLSLCLLVAWTLVCAVLIRGISSLGKVRSSRFFWCWWEKERYWWTSATSFVMIKISHKLTD